MCRIVTGQKLMLSVDSVDVGCLLVVGCVDGKEMRCVDWVPCAAKILFATSAMTLLYDLGLSAEDCVAFSTMTPTPVTNGIPF